MQRIAFETSFVEWLGLVDLGMTRVCNRFGRRFVVRRFFVLVSRLGDGLYWYALMLVLPCVYGGTGLAVSGRMGLVGMLGLGVYKAIKSYTARPRPFVRSHRIAPGTPPLDQYSFPSGHTLHATAFTLVAVAGLPALFWWTVPFALCVAFSRLVLGLHYPSDVLAGAILGTVLAGLVLAF